MIRCYIQYPLSDSSSLLFFFSYFSTISLHFFFFFLMIRPPPSSPLFPYPTLSRSLPPRPHARRQERLERDRGALERHADDHRIERGGQGLAHLSSGEGHLLGLEREVADALDPVEIGRAHV